MKFLHLSDTHILRNYKDIFISKLNIDPTENFLKTLRHINAKHSDAEFIIISGDLTYNGTVEDYRFLKNILEKKLKQKIYFALGNHDYSANFREGFFGEKSDEPFYYCEINNGLRIICLDTNCNNEDSGFLDKKQLDWLEKLLKEDSENGSIIIMHHPPVTEFKDGLLGYALKNSEEFYNIVNHSDVIAVLSGHTHKNAQFGINYTADSASFGVDFENGNMKIDDTIGFNVCEIINKKISVHSEKVNPMIFADRENFRLGLEGCLNFRDIGGYDTIDGKNVVSGKIYRADSLAKLTEKDIDALKSLGINVVIDLRYSNETENEINPLNNLDGFEYYNVSLLDGVFSNDLKGGFPPSLEEMYIQLVDEAKDLLIEVLRIIIKSSDKKIVYHCTAGKDRTGVITVLLLLLAGVSKEEIINDYSLTYGYIKDSVEKMIENAVKTGIVLPRFLFKSDRESMIEFLDYFTKKYGDVEKYLLQVSMKKEEILELKNILIEK